MIFCNNKIYAKVWAVTPSEKYIDLRISTSEKDQNGEYINSSWFPRLIGHAFNSLKDKIKVGDKITITKAKFSNEKYTAKDGTVKSAFRFIILEASIDEENANAPTAAGTAPAKTEQQETAASNDDCPW